MFTSWQGPPSFEVAPSDLTARAPDVRSSGQQWVVFSTAITQPRLLSIWTSSSQVQMPSSKGSADYVSAVQNRLPDSPWLILKAMNTIPVKVCCAHSLHAWALSMYLPVRTWSLVKRCVRFCAQNTTYSMWCSMSGRFWGLSSLASRSKIHWHTRRLRCRITPRTIPPQDWCKWWIRSLLKCVVHTVCMRECFRCNYRCERNHL